MANYAATIELKRAKKNIIDVDLYNRYEITGGTAAWKGELFVLKTATQPGDSDTMTITVT